jgi:hypothetical protein
LDNFSKEELIKLIKKYVILQKQLKLKNEDLTNKLNESQNVKYIFLLIVISELVLKKISISFVVNFLLYLTPSCIFCSHEFADLLSAAK